MCCVPSMSVWGVQGVLVCGGKGGREVLSLPNPEGGTTVVKANTLLLSTKQLIK